MTDNPPLERTDPVERAELLELLELGGDYAADVFNGFHDKTSPCALRVERNLERFNRAHAALAMSAKAMGGE